MQKIILQGHNLEALYQENLATIYKGDEIKEYLQAPNFTFREIFIHAHGNEFFTENLLASQLTLSLYPNDSSQLAHNILSKIAENTEENKPNVVHILSCHSGAAHHNLHEVNGDIILCTYAPATNITIKYITDHLFNKINSSESFGEFIVKNLPLLTAIGFGLAIKKEMI